MMFMFQNFVNWCSQAPCKNGGTCTQLANQFECSCMYGWTGGLCDVRMVGCMAAANDKRVSVHQLCQNGGTCRDTTHSHVCECQPGYDGSYCEVEIDECASAPCKNGATCFNLKGGRYTCQCPKGFQVNLNFKITKV